MSADAQGGLAQSTVNLSGLLIGLGLTVILGGVTFALIKYDIPKDNQNALLILIGILSTNIGVIVNWHFGSSAANRKQTETISTLANTAASAQAALPIVAGVSDPKEKKVTLDPGQKASVQAKVVCPDTITAEAWAVMTPEQQLAAATKEAP
jgi:xanthosine utilization system XapX-like protein